MACSSTSLLSYPFLNNINLLKPSNYLYKPMNLSSFKTQFTLNSTLNTNTQITENVQVERPTFKWLEIKADNMSESQKHAISHLPKTMEKRCKAFMRQIICFSPEKGSLSDLLAAWVRTMKPRRADWLNVLKELKYLDHPLFLEVILTAMVHMYSKAGHFKLAEETFDEMKLLGQPLDKKSYGSMIMAYIRAGMPNKGEDLINAMEHQEIYPGQEVYRALLRTYSRKGDAEGARRVFEAIQVAGICPDSRMCGLLIRAYHLAGQSQNAYVAFDNMRKAGIEPNDKCVAVLLATYEKENRLNTALDFLVSLERDGIVIGKEASQVLAEWFRRLGVEENVANVLRECVGNVASS